MANDLLISGKNTGNVTAYNKNNGIPSKFNVCEKRLTLTTSFSVSSDAGEHGSVRAKFFNLSTQFEFKDKSDNLVATGKKALVSWGTRIDVYDSQNNKIGTIREEVLKSLFKRYTSYKILDSNGNEIAKSKKLDFGATGITLYNPSGKEIATIDRPWINIFRDNWNIDIKDRSAVDMRILVLIGAYKTYSDNAKSSSDSSNSSRPKSNSKK
ncbi:MAG: hypothetical protein PHV30_03115 [Candidatus Margulisbacteria bacterium]|nr:hypothetical protein [Candidatus Margulisiibacteriota bacterium]